MNPDEAFQTAVNYQRGGRLTEAEQLYRAILAQQPDHADALYRMGSLANQMGRFREASEWLGKAIAVRPSAPFFTELAVALARAGDKKPALQARRQALALEPHSPAMHSGLGTALQQQGQFDEAIASFQQAISLEPNNPNWHYNLGNALLTAKQFAESAQSYRRCLQLAPNHIGALNNLGRALHKMGRSEEAAQTVRQALHINPTLPQVLNNLAAILTSLGQLDEAVDMLCRAIAAGARSVDVYNTLGKTLWRLGRLTESVAVFRQALQLNPQAADIYHNLSVSLRGAGDLDAATIAAKTALQLRPDYPLAQGGLAYLMQLQGEMDQAIDISSQLAAAHPHDEVSLTIHGNSLRLVGRFEEALDCFRRAADAAPGNFVPASNYLFTLQFHLDDPMALKEEHRKWEAKYAAPLRPEIQPFSNRRDPERRLRIGYVSPDFRHHCQALFTNALFPHHDREQFEIYCYSGVAQPDAVTARLRQHADVWRHIYAVSDDAVANLIRADGIDILVDLTMHMSECRPLLFARKPAPIQLAWLAYPGTTGLLTMDYRLTDPYLDPPGFDDRYTETSLRLPETFWCYQPHGMVSTETEMLPEPGPLPASNNGFVTFGCLNEFCKGNIQTWQRWAKLMREFKNSRIHLLARRGRSTDQMFAEFAKFDITPDRIELIARQSRPQYLAEYRRIDLCLDTLPYNGHTTSLDALWMGVPVLTQIGRTVVGRAGFSQLMNLQLPEFATDTDDQFLAAGTRWANDLSGLAELRRTLRDRMAASPLMDAPRFTRNMEMAFRKIWKHWAMSNTSAAPTR